MANAFVLIETSRRCTQFIMTKLIFEHNIFPQQKPTKSFNRGTQRHGKKSLPWSTEDYLMGNKEPAPSQPDTHTSETQICCQPAQNMCKLKAFDISFITCALQSTLFFVENAFSSLVFSVKVILIYVHCSICSNAQVECTVVYWIESEWNRPVIMLHISKAAFVANEIPHFMQLLCQKRSNVKKFDDLYF